MSEVRADLHIHLDKSQTKQSVIDILKRAEERNVKAVCMLEHTKLGIDMYNQNSPIIALENQEGISKYFSGKVITGAEFTCEIQDKTNLKYDKNLIHILIYDFNPKEFSRLKWFENDFIMEKNYIEAELLIEKCKKYNLPHPKKEDFDFKIGPAPQNLYHFCMANDFKKQYEEVVGPFETKSDFMREIYKTDNKMFIGNFSSPSVLEVAQISKDLNCKIVLAHPYYMYSYFEGLEYAKYMINYFKKYAVKTFDGIETQYMKNTEQQYENLKKFALEENLFETSGSDYQYFYNKDGSLGTMFYEMQGQDKIIYQPQPAKWICSEVEGFNKFLTMEETTLQKFNDIRSYLKK